MEVSSSHSLLGCLVSSAEKLELFDTQGLPQTGVQTMPTLEVWQLG